jgi:mRNA interferase RelE/StbE
MYSVKLSSYAQKFYSKADLTLAKKLSKCFLNLQENPYASNNIKRLSGILKGSYRYRVYYIRLCCEDNN